MPSPVVQIFRSLRAELSAGLDCTVAKDPIPNIPVTRYTSQATSDYLSSKLQTPPVSPEMTATMNYSTVTFPAQLSSGSGLTESVLCVQTGLDWSPGLKY